MNYANPAIVAQSAVRRLPRVALLLMCAAYVLAGYLGRSPWRSADVTAFGFMRELANNPAANWLAPSLLDRTPSVGGLLPYWLGALMIKIAPAGIAPEFVVRLPFIAMLALTLAATWYAVYYLAIHPGAQPVAFAFGGQADTKDYARAIADGSLLALIATLGLAQFSHETTPALAQLTALTLVFFGMAAMPYRAGVATTWAVIGLLGLFLSGAPSLGLWIGGGSALLMVLARHAAAHMAPEDRHDPRLQTLDRPVWAIVALGLATLLGSWVAWQTGQFQWTLTGGRSHWPAIGRLFLWFTWPAWPFALWTLWRWRHQLRNLRAHRHLALPLMFVLPAIVATIWTDAGDRALLLALPALCTLAAFALPTFDRSMSALIDWFTLLFFSILAIIIWVVWLAMMTGYPPKPAANVAKLAPGFEPSFSPIALAAALFVTLAWAWLVRWRTKRSRAAIWKSLVLPAGGAALCWVLMMSLWLGALDFGLSYVPQMRAFKAQVGETRCLYVKDLGPGQITALDFHAGYTLKVWDGGTQCELLVMSQTLERGRVAAPLAIPAGWQARARIGRPTNADDTLVVLARAAGTPTATTH